MTRRARPAEADASGEQEGPGRRAGRIGSGWTAAHEESGPAGRAAVAEARRGARPAGERNDASAIWMPSAWTTMSQPENVMSQPTEIQADTRPQPRRRGRDRRKRTMSWLCFPWVYG